MANTAVTSTGLMNAQTVTTSSANLFRTTTPSEILGLLNDWALGPTETIQQQRSWESVASIRIPRDLPPYYFRMEMKEYRRTGWNTIGTQNSIGSVKLPVPNSIVDTHAVSWEGEELGILGGMTTNLLNGGNGSDEGGGLGAAGRGALRLGLAAGGSIAGNVAGAVASQYGVAINNYLTMMLKGPVYKKHQFTWRVSPKNEAEAKDLMNLYKVVNNAQAPAISGWGSAFFRYPRIFHLSFMHESVDMGERLFRFKPSAVTASSWNFTPQNIAAFFGKTKSPVSLEFTIEFTELEYWLSGDFK